MALIVSSFGKMLLILMVIWDYKQLEYSWLVSIIVLTSNIEALSGKSKQLKKRLTSIQFPPTSYFISSVLAHWLF